MFLICQIHHMHQRLLQPVRKVRKSKISKEGESTDEFLRKLQEMEDKYIESDVPMNQRLIFED